MQTVTDQDHLDDIRAAADLQHLRSRDEEAPRGRGAVDVVPGIRAEGEGHEEVQDHPDGRDQTAPYEIGSVAVRSAVGAGGGFGHEGGAELHAKRNEILHDDEGPVGRVREAGDDIPLEDRYEEEDPRARCRPIEHCDD